MMISEDHYQILGVSRHASESEIGAAYRVLALRYHPDKGDTCDLGKFKKCAEAFETLSDPRKKRAYDEILRLQSRRAQFAQEAEDGLATLSAFYQGNKGLAIAEICSRLERQGSSGIKIVGVDLMWEKKTCTAIEVTIQICSPEAGGISGRELATEREIIQASFTALGAGLLSRRESVGRAAEQAGILSQSYKVGADADCGLINALDQPKNFACVLDSGEGLHAAKYPIRSGFLLAGRLHASCLEEDFTKYMSEVLRNDARWGVVYNTRADKHYPALMLGECRLPFVVSDVEHVHVSGFYRKAIRILLGKLDRDPAGVVTATLKKGYRDSDVGAFAIANVDVFKRLRELKAVPAEVVSHCLSPRS
jgi:hypothetical protein